MPVVLWNLMTCLGSPALKNLQTEELRGDPEEGWRVIWRKINTKFSILLPQGKLPAWTWCPIRWLYAGGQVMGIQCENRVQERWVKASQLQHQKNLEVLVQRPERVTRSRYPQNWVILDQPEHHHLQLIFPFIYQAEQRLTVFPSQTPHKLFLVHF